MADAGTVILFVSLIAALGVVGSIVLAYSAHCFLTVVQDTAAGMDEVVWSGESAGEWFGQAALLGWLAAVWLAPLALTLRTLKPAFVQEQPALVVLLVGVVLWLFFPIGVLSALSGLSRWSFFRPKLLYGLARIAPTALGFYTVSPLLVGAGLAVWYVALKGSGLLLAVASLVGSAALLIYARLLGRVAWKLNRLEPARRHRPRPRKEPPPARAVSAEEPSDVPAGPRKQRQPRMEEAAPAEVYGLAEEEPPPRPALLPLDGYSPIEEEQPEPPPEPDALERRLARRTPQEKVPAHPLLEGVYTFPFYRTTLPVWLKLALGSFLTGGIFKLLPTLPG